MYPAKDRSKGTRAVRCALCVLGLFAMAQWLPAALALQIRVQDPQGNPVSGFRWLVEENNTLQPEPGALVSDPLAVSIHKSHAPVVATGRSATNVANVGVPNSAAYVVSVLPDAGYTLGGACVAVGQNVVNVIVNPYPVPTAQISILAFEDNWPLNNAPELPTEAGLPGFTVVISDALGQLSVDAFGNPLGTTYVFQNGQWVPNQMGTGVITTDQFGQALVKFLAPGKYGVQIVPPPGQNWIQTTTLEGTPTIDAWVKAGEPPVFVEFGPAAYHVFMGFIRPFNTLSQLPPGSGTGSITGRLVYNHFGAPPNLQGFFSGPPVEDGWVGLNEAFSRQAVYAQACNPSTGEFTIAGIPEGVYQLVTWDLNLDSIIGFRSLSIPDRTDPNNPIWNIDAGDVLAFNWFGTLEGSVFYDEDLDGFRDEMEMGLPDQAVNLRFRDGTIYQARVTDPNGNYSFTEVFPFFKWLVTEVDFARFRDTGFTNVVDAGGAIPPDAGWQMPSRGKLNPQPQVDLNPNTGNNLSRTETGGPPGAFLLQAMQLYLGQTNVIDWGKTVYEPGESGGISGVVYYAVTRAEDDPRYGAADAWEPGIPRAQIALYLDADENGIIDDLVGGDGPTRADRDNYPLGWLGGGPKGTEDVDWNGNNQFDAGDAIQIAYTDSWDDNPPSGCIQNLPLVHGQPAPECFDNFGTWNQIRPGVFDGGYAITSHFPGGMAVNPVEEPGIPPNTYIVEAAPPKGYKIVAEEDKNVDFGDEYYPKTDALPPACVGNGHVVPPFLSLFPGVPAPFAGQNRKLCDRKQVFHSGAQNTAVDFFCFTDVPKAARAVGFINNDLAAEFNQASPVYGEKQAPSWIPISFQDYAGNEITRVYCDEFGAYNALLPSSFTVNVPCPTGVSPHMISMVLNHPGPIPHPLNPSRLIVDPWFDPSYSQTPYTFNFESGRTTYLDTPVIPVAAFAGYPTRSFDVEPPSGTPLIYSVEGSAGGPLVCTDGEVVTIRSVGLTPGPVGGGGPPVFRDYGFGQAQGQVTVNGVPLQIVSWNNIQIRARVLTANVSTGQLLVKRADNGRTTPIGLTLHVLECGSTIYVSGGSAWPNTKIQNAIDAASPGTLILVGPGVYKENLIIYKNVRIQGSGAGGTIINGNPVPFERVTAWHAKILALIASGELAPIDPGMFEPIEAPCVFVHGKPETFGADARGLLDGFTVMGGVSGGGVYLAGYADYYEVSNNKLINNQGSVGGGITVGIVDNNGFNDHVNIHHNVIAKNGGIDGGGGVTIYRGSDGYSLSNNRIIGNFTRNVGGGVAHFGRSDGGVIAGNEIVFNEVFYGALIGGDGGGLYIAGDPIGGVPPALGDGAGSVTVVSNLIQGNLAGSGSGGGIRAQFINGNEVVGQPSTSWYTLNLFNNVIVNNVAAFRGGGVALQDAARVNMIHNTIANNDCTATASLAFSPGNLVLSNPQGAGLVVTPHTAVLAAATGQTFSSPTLVNNVLWHNRSFYWDATLNQNAGGLVPNTPAYWDLQVVGGGTLAPQYCLLTDTTGYAATNISGDPLFQLSYFNTLLTAAVFDEGGNSITVRYTELTTGAGNYHLQATSAARNAADPGYTGQFPQLASDFDNEVRPQGTGTDIGADERP